VQQPHPSTVLTSTHTFAHRCHNWHSENNLIQREIQGGLPSTTRTCDLRLRSLLAFLKTLRFQCTTVAWNLSYLAQSEQWVRLAPSGFESAKRSIEWEIYLIAPSSNGKLRRVCHQLQNVLWHLITRIARYTTNGSKQSEKYSSSKYNTYGDKRCVFTNLRQQHNQC